MSDSNYVGHVASHRLKEKLNIYRQCLSSHNANMATLLLGLDFLENQLCDRNAKRLLQSMRAVVNSNSVRHTFQDIFKEIEALKDESRNQ